MTNHEEKLMIYKLFNGNLKIGWNFSGFDQGFIRILDKSVGKL